MNPPPFFIRPATAADAPVVMDFIRQLAVYEKLEHMVVNTTQKLLETVFAEGSNVRTLLVCEGDELQSKPVGFALYFYNYSTFLGQKGIYLEDLFVPPEHRSKGYGKALMLHLARLAVAEGCGRFEWSVLDWNEPSIKFYRSLGAVGMDEWTAQRVSGQALLDLAAR
jgi:GNAT superfamily N-acetyltransferase